MKTKTIIIFILFTLLNNPSFGQSLVDSLTCDDYDIIFNKLDEIVEQYRVEAIPIIHNIIEQSNPYVQLQFLHTLDALNDLEIRGYTHALIDRADQFASHESPEDPLFAKVDASGILFKYNDFSTAEYLIEYIELKKPNVYWFLDLLQLVYQNVPAYRQVIKDDLVNILENAEYETNRFIALEHLIEFAGTESITNIVDAFDNNTKSSIRFLAFKGLIKLNYQELNSLFKSRLSLDSDDVIRTEIADTLLIKFGTPSDLKAVIDYQPNEPDEISRRLMGHSIQDFIPPRPTIATADMIDSLISYTAQLLQYNWIKDSINYKTYLTELENQKKLYIQKDEDNLNDSIEYFLELVEEHHKLELLTEEGYKYLHYYGTYVKENVENDF
jgi:hypothetical protein